MEILSNAQLSAMKLPLDTNPNGTNYFMEDTEGPGLVSEGEEQTELEINELMHRVKNETRSFEQSRSDLKVSIDE